MKPLVLFGAGRNASHVYKELSSTRYNPVCFCDSNPNKVGSILSFAPTLQVITLEDALNRYPDAVFFVTPVGIAKYEIGSWFKAKKEILYDMYNVIALTDNNTSKLKHFTDNIIFPMKLLIS